MPVLSTVEAQLSLHKCNITKEPQKHGNAKKPVANYEQAEGHNLHWNWPQWSTRLLVSKLSSLLPSTIEQQVLS